VPPLGPGGKDAGGEPPNSRRITARARAGDFLRTFYAVYEGTGKDRGRELEQGIDSLPEKKFGLLGIKRAQTLRESVAGGETVLRSTTHQRAEKSR